MGRKGGRALNPTDAFRKQQRKKELKKVRHTLWRCCGASPQN
jgi:hypothetical protein